MRSTVVRHIIGAEALSKTALLLMVAAPTGLTASSPTAALAERPNILWLTSEDHGPHMGCYGDRYATTPHVNALAAKGIIYTHVWSCAPVCAPARTTLISGMYPTSTGSEHMRSMVPFPAGKKMFPQLLRAAGYYCTNNAKEDYNLTQPGRVWDESSRTAHWKNRDDGQPFFAVFNSEKSHESRVRARPHAAVHDPAEVRVPAYHPDTSEVRQDWAQYYDCVNAADADAGGRLAELEAAGLAEETIVFYFADHGSGMPRNKRWPYNSGLHVPLVIYIPAKFRDLRPAEDTHPHRSDRLVSFVDFAPTVLSLAGIEPPEWMQGHAFLGRYAAQAQPYLYGFRGRMDERYDMVRSVTDGRYVYIRNYMPHKIYGQHVSYMFQTPTTQVWQRLHRERKLSAAQEAFWNTKPPEELYDLTLDRDEVHNLAGSSDHAELLARFRKAQRDWVLAVRDVGFLPEGEIHTRSSGTTPYDMGQDKAKYPLERIMEMAELAARMTPAAIVELKAGLRDDDSAVRYWAALGFLMRGRAGVESEHDALVKALVDPSPYVQIVAAEALTRFGVEPERRDAVDVLLVKADWNRNDVFVTMAALCAIGEAAGDHGAELRQKFELLSDKGPAPHARYAEYVPRLLQGLK